MSAAGASLAQGASVSRGGSFVAAICSDHIVRVWSAGSGELLRSLNESSKPQSAVQFSPDGRSLAVAYEIAQYEKCEIKIFDVDSWNRVVLYDLRCVWQSPRACMLL